MSSKIEDLLVIQDRDRRINRLEREIEDLPQRQRLIEAQLDSHKKALHNAEEDIRKKGLEQKDIESQIEQRQERIRKFRQQQFEVKNNDDYKAFEKQIEAQTKEIAALEERQLDIMESLEQLEEVSDTKRAALKEEEQVVAADMAQFEQRVANLQAELDEVKADREKIAETIDPEWLSRYDRLFAHLKDFAVVPVENGACGGCHMKLPPQATHDARRLDSMTLCMYCGRILYYIP